MHQILTKTVAVAFVSMLSLVSAGPVHLHNRRSTGLSVEIAESGPTEVTATVKNTGDEALHLFTAGTVLDSAPVRKVNVFKDDSAVVFTGINAVHATHDLPEDEFIVLEPGASTSAPINLAAVFELGDGGDFTVQSIDTIPFAKADSTTLFGVYEYESNSIVMHITADEIQKVAPAIAPLSARAALQSCSGSQGTATRNALNAAVRFANNGASAASGGSATKFQEYFRTTSASTRSNVAARFRAIAQEASSTTSGATTYYCVDPQGVCGGSIIAYAQPARNLVANCPRFYSLPATSRGCDDQSQASTVVHEFTHTPGVFAPSTVDYAYGYSASTRLSASQALANADNYALYADAVTLGC